MQQSAADVHNVLCAHVVVRAQSACHSNNIVIPAKPAP